MRGRKCNHIAFSCDNLCAKKPGGQSCNCQPLRPLAVRALRTAILVQGLILCLLFLDSAVVVHKDQGALVLRVTVALRSLVAGAQVTGWIVSWQRGFRRGFLLPSAYLQSTHDAGLAQSRPTATASSCDAGTLEASFPGEHCIGDVIYRSR